MNRPTGVTVAAVYYFLVACLLLLAGLAMILGGGFLGTMLAERSGLSAGIVAAIGAGLGVFFLLLCALYGFTGWGLLRLKEWARITAVVLSGIASCFALLGLLLCSASPSTDSSSGTCSSR